MFLISGQKITGHRNKARHSPSGSIEEINKSPKSASNNKVQINNLKREVTFKKTRH